MSFNEILMKLNMFGVALAGPVNGNGDDRGGRLPVEFTDDPLIHEEFQSIGGILGAILNVVFYVGIALTIIFLIIGGIQYIMSGGDETKVAGARGHITNAIIGFIVVIGAFTIKIIIEKWLGVTGMPTEILPPF